MPKLISDEKLFAIVLYSAFVSNNHLTSVRDVWKSPWITGTSGALAIGLVGAIVAPFILTAIIRGLGFGLGGIAAHSFGSWFMSLYRGTIARGSVVSILQSIGAVGLGALSIFLSSGFGAAIGILIGAIGGFKLAEYLTEINLIKTEEQLLESFVQIEENNNIIIFKIKPALLYNEEALKCFFETFKSSSSFVNSKLFRIDFIENDLKLKSEEERIHTVHNLLVDNYEKFRIECIYNDGYLVGYNVNLSDYKPSDPKINTLVEIWNVMNGNVVIEFIDKIRDQVNDQIRNVDVNKFRDQVNDQINKADINGLRDHVNNQINQISDQVSKVDINKIRDQVNDHINNIDINKLGSQIGDQVNNQINQIKQVDINKFRDQVNDHVKNINVNEVGNQISNHVNGIFRKWF
ncbi:uncharacterized protein OCT59_006308 [Rhizophagus irregularis]|uniref:Uncharacterized protein n=3 Tax=Rhizophagus irregularis TaxID=588596 RepID=A0A015L8I0_RHIIW|nr:hypothetical protein RirG_101330 [Rhizophagus irregularis DAOM 197198w]UZO14864.1 hypothetical protein OCT59_006308 [Rhizophagus irregularis]GBC18226.1 interferon alpha-inducible protein 27, mitochondrial isoform 1 [Rhizophagus irregularis DAOM 181602=DAOM 197198]